MIYNTWYTLCCVSYFERWFLCLTFILCYTNRSQISIVTYNIMVREHSISIISSAYYLLPSYIMQIPYICCDCKHPLSLSLPLSVWADVVIGRFFMYQKVFLVRVCVWWLLKYCFIGYPLVKTKAVELILNIKNRTTTQFNARPARFCSNRVDNLEYFKMKKDSILQERSHSR